MRTIWGQTQNGRVRRVLHLAEKIQRLELAATVRREIFFASILNSFKK